MSRQPFLCGQIPGYITRARVAELVWEYGQLRKAVFGEEPAK
jgi:hypothetical protein